MKESLFSQLSQFMTRTTRRLEIKHKRRIRTGPVRSDPRTRRFRSSQTLATRRTTVVRMSHRNAGRSEHVRSTPVRVRTDQRSWLPLETPYRRVAMAWLLDEITTPPVIEEGNAIAQRTPTRMTKATSCRRSGGPAVAKANPACSAVTTLTTWTFPLQQVVPSVRP